MISCHTQKASNFTNFQEMTEEFQKTLRHDDFTYSTDLCTTVPWMDTMVTSLTHLESSKYRLASQCCSLADLFPFLCRLQQLHFNIAKTLAQLKECQLEKAK